MSAPEMGVLAALRRADSLSLRRRLSGREAALVAACQGGHLKAASLCLVAGAQPTDACFEVAVGNTELTALLADSQATE